MVSKDLFPHLHSMLGLPQQFMVYLTGIYNIKGCFFPLPVSKKASLEGPLI